MKNRLTFILAAVTAIFMTSCVKDIEPQEIDGSITVGEEHDGKVTLTFTPDFGQAVGTKALAQKPDVRNIYFALFDMAGYKLSEYVEAVLDEPAANENDTKFTYSVDLTVTGQARILHILANAPENLNFGSESEVIGSLFTKFEDGVGMDGYWQRIVLPGIYAKPKAGEPDYDEKLEKYNGLVNTLTNVKLLRNFSSITVHTDSESNFTLKGFWLTNVPDRGSFAPYNRKTRDFVDDYTGYGTAVALMSADGASYDGFTPSSAGLISVGNYAGADLEAGNSGFSTSELGRKMVSVSDQAAGNTAFCYERELPRENPVYIIICGRYTGENATGKDTFYKVDLRDQDGKYFPILRNFNYKVKVRSVSRDGAATVRDALSSTPSGDISTSLDMMGLNNISDGNAQLSVSETEKVVIGSSTNTSPVVWSYKFVPDIDHPDAVANTPLPMLIAPYPGAEYADEAAVRAAGLSYVTIDSAPGSTGAVFSNYRITSYDDGADHFSTVEFYPLPASDVVKTETVTITGWYPVTVGGTTEYKSITRQAIFRLREYLMMDVHTVPEIVAGTRNSKVDVVIGIEPNLPSSVFPLDMSIEAEKNSLIPDIDGRTGASVELPVSSGRSLFDGDKPGYHYIRTITWSEYESMTSLVDGKKQFHTYFKTNRDVSASQVKVDNAHYLPGVTYFKNPGDADAFYGLAFGNDLLVGTSRDSKTDFSFLVTSPTTVNIQIDGAYELSCGPLTVNPDLTGSGGNYAMTLDAPGTYYIHGISATAYNSAVNVTLSADGYEPQSKSVDRLGFLSAGNNISSDRLSADFGVTSWAGSSGAGKLTATTSGGVEFEVPVLVTRRVLGSSEDNIYFDAPANSESEVRCTNGGTSNRTITINLAFAAMEDYDYYYYYNSDSESAPSATDEGTKITSTSTTKSLPSLSRTSTGSRTLYIRRVRKDNPGEGITGVESSGWSSWKFQKTSRSSSNWDSVATFTKNSKQGYYTTASVSYEYAFTGPLSDVTFNATGLTLDASDMITLSYGGTDYGRICASRLENDVKADVLLQRPSELGLSTPDDQSNLVITAKGTDISACRYCLCTSAVVDAATDITTLLQTNGTDLTTDQLTSVMSSAGCRITVGGLTAGTEYELLCQFTDSKGNTAFYSATRTHTAASE